MKHDMKLDAVGPWTEVKLSVIRDYVAPYSTILKRQGQYASLPTLMDSPELASISPGLREMLCLEVQQSHSSMDSIDTTL